jgi:simple sugar transport system ATP-binding protein
MGGEGLMSEAIRAQYVTKMFGTVVALAGVSVAVNRGETLGILGDNGAGKSTLMKILTGYHQPDSGQVYVDGNPVDLASVDAARALGIECVYQDLALVNGISVYHNMFLNRELLRPGPFRFLDHKAMRREARAALSAIGVDVPSVEINVGALSGGQRQAIAVARAVHSNARILLLDEPLAAMGAREAQLIIGLIERLKARGDIAIVMIAHNYAQTLEICDRVVLMQHGEITFESTTAATSAAELLDIVRREYRAARGA